MMPELKHTLNLPDAGDDARSSSPLAPYYTLLQIHMLTASTSHWPILLRFSQIIYVFAYE